MKEKQPIKYSKLIVALVILLNAAFAAGTLIVFFRIGSEPTVLITAWFGFTTGELLMLAGIKKREQVPQDKTENEEENPNG